MKRDIKSEYSVLDSETHYSWPPIDEAVKRAVMKQLDESISIYDRSGIFERFEDLFKKIHNRKHALLCSSGTLAIHSMYVALGLKKGDEVICPAYTFFATVSPLLFTGAVPVLCDCDENGNIDPGQILKHISQKTKAVIVTHMWGIPCKMNEISEICKRFGLYLLEDCSHAHGASIGDKLVGSFGDMSAWSIQGAKTVSGGEGGILTTNNSELYYRSLLLGHYNKRCKQEIPSEHTLSKYAVTGMGLKYRAHPLAITIALETLKKLSRYLVVKDRFARQMIKKLERHGLIPPKFTEINKPSWYNLVFTYRPEKFNDVPISVFYDYLKKEGLKEVDRPMSTAPLNLLPLFQKPEEIFPDYAQVFSYKKGDFPKAEAFYESIIKLPVWGRSTDKRFVNAYVDTIIKVIQKIKHE